MSETDSTAATRLLHNASVLYTVTLTDSRNWSLKSGFPRLNHQSLALVGKLNSREFVRTDYAADPTIVEQRE